VRSRDLTLPPEPLPQSVVEDQLVIGKNMTIKIDVYNAGDRYARAPSSRTAAAAARATHRRDARRRETPSALRRRVETAAPCKKTFFVSAPPPRARRKPKPSRFSSTTT
jgi:hypothetical protein